jgi:hypothetical protein
MKNCCTYLGRLTTARLGSRAIGYWPLGKIRVPIKRDFMEAQLEGGSLTPPTSLAPYRNTFSQFVARARSLIRTKSHRNVLFLHGNEF